jgi:hypothetical protein
VDALYAVFDEDREPATQDLLNLSRDTVPLSKTMSETITNLRQWCEGRARCASSNSLNQTKIRKVKVGG